PHLDPVAKGAWTALFGGPAYLVLTSIVGWNVPGWAALLAVMAFVGGFAVVGTRLGDAPPRGEGPDHRARLLSFNSAERRHPRRPEDGGRASTARSDGTHADPRTEEELRTPGEVGRSDNARVRAELRQPDLGGGTVRPSAEPLAERRPRRADQH